MQLKVFAGMGQRIVRNQCGDMAKLRLFAAQKLAPRGRIEEEVAHSDGRAGRQPRIFDAQQASAGDLHGSADFIFPGARFKAHASDGRNRRQRLSAKAQGRNGQQIIRRPQLRSRVPLKGEQSIVSPHAVAIVDNADQLAATGFDLYPDARCPRVEGIFKKLFDDRSRALHNLSGRNLVRNLVGENADLTHR